MKSKSKLILLIATFAFASTAAFATTLVCPGKDYSEKDLMFKTINDNGDSILEKSDMSTDGNFRPVDSMSVEFDSDAMEFSAKGTMDGKAFRFEPTMDQNGNSQMNEYEEYATTPKVLNCHLEN